MRYILLILFSISVFAVEPNTDSKANTENMKRLDELTKVILEGNYKERRAAIDELVKLKIDVAILQQRIDANNDPELKAALKKAIDRILTWSDPDEEKWDSYPVFGKNDDGMSLYLVKAEIDGEIVIGKVWKGIAGHFPHDGKEVLVDKFKIWHQAGTWRKWQKDLKSATQLGVNKQGKKIYAARARFKDGIHIGMYIEGSDKALIPWGGISHPVENFEVMVEKRAKGSSELDQAIKDFKVPEQPIIRFKGEVPIEELLEKNIEIQIKR